MRPASRRPAVVWRACRGWDGQRAGEMLAGRRCGAPPVDAQRRGSGWGVQRGVVEGGRREHARAALYEPLAGEELTPPVALHREVLRSPSSRPPGAARTAATGEWGRGGRGSCVDDESRQSGVKRRPARVWHTWRCKEGACRGASPSGGPTPEIHAGCRAALARPPQLCAGLLAYGSCGLHPTTVGQAMKGWKPTARPRPHERRLLAPLVPLVSYELAEPSFLLCSATV